MKQGWLSILVAVLLSLSVPDAAWAQKSGSASTKASKASKAGPVKKAQPAQAGRKAVKARAQRSGKAAPRKTARRVVPARPSEGQLAGLHRTEDPLDLRSSVALVVDQNTNEVLLAKNDQAVLPIASITKLMTALVVADAQLSLDEPLVVSREDVAIFPGRQSRLTAGTSLTRGELLHLALMSSENRAAHALGRTFPGGMVNFVGLMNAKARELGMRDTHYVEPTGLSSDNRSSAQDLVRLAKAAFSFPILRELSTSVEAAMPVGRRNVQFRTTNGLVRNPQWDIGLQKTGYIAAAGRCVVMQAELAGRQLIMVLLDSAGRYSRIGDAERIRSWLGAGASPMVSPQPAREAHPTDAAGIDPSGALTAPMIQSLPR
ncbi:MAG: serine hydrolase [Rubrivivax sp.]|jgi:D-alanyl-D-alanine endopeptidase (penicillin-binding protein 7)